jgi:DNA-directed RNA polymerase specialized sigma24 family protein
MSDTLTEEEKLAIYIELAPKVAVSRWMKAIGYKVVYKKLGSVVKTGGELEYIAEDAVSEVSTKLLERLNVGVLPDSLANAKMRRTAVRKYLLKSVNNYCNTRLENWSLLNRSGKYGPRSRVSLYQNSPAKNIDGDGERSDNEVWDTIAPNLLSLDEIDSEKLQSMLVDAGISSEDMGYLNAHFSDMSYVEMAAYFGGTEDKYRKRIQRLLQKVKANISV